MSIYVRAGSLIQAKTVPQHSMKTDLDVNYCDQEINYACLIFFNEIRAKTYSELCPSKNIYIYIFFEYLSMDIKSLHGKLTSGESLISPCGMTDIYTLTLFLPMPNAILLLKWNVSP